MPAVSRQLIIHVRDQWQTQGMGEEKKILMRGGYPLTGEGGYFLSCNVGGTVMGMGNGYPLMSIH